MNTKEEYRIIVAFIIIIILLIPGRMQGYYYKSFFKGKKLLVRRKYEESIRHSKEFLDSIRRDSSKKKLMFYSFGIYTKDIETMTLNNLGAAYVGLKDIITAEAYFNEAISQDSLYSKPYFNLSIVELIKGNEERAKELHKKSNDLGFKALPFEVVVKISENIAPKSEDKWKDKIYEEVEEKEETLNTNMLVKKKSDKNKI